MNPKAFAKSYPSLTPEERFRLILAAGARGDEAEQDRLHRAGDRITLSMSDYSPWSHAFDELAMMVFLELLEEAAKHQDAFERWCDADEVWSPETDAGFAAEDREADARDSVEIEDVENVDEPPSVGVASPNQDDQGLMPTRMLNLYLAQGFMLKTKLAGWKLFCERLSIPPFALWQILPGFKRLEHALELLEDNRFRLGPAFRPEGMLRWLSKIRPEGAPEPTLDMLISPERFADDLDKVFRERVAWWGG
jgi:hypothetical protein